MGMDRAPDWPTRLPCPGDRVERDTSVTDTPAIGQDPDIADSDQTRALCVGRW